jgi:hypothetical protein
MTSAPHIIDINYAVIVDHLYSISELLEHSDLWASQFVYNTERYIRCAPNMLYFVYYTLFDVFLKWNNIGLDREYMKQCLDDAVNAYISTQCCVSYRYRNINMHKIVPINIRTVIEDSMIYTMKLYNKMEGLSP